MYDLCMKEEYKDDTGEKKATFHKVGVAFDAKKGGFDLVIAPGVAISGKAYVRPRRERAGAVDNGADFLD
jgi:hypothetical protein